MLHGIVCAFVRICAPVLYKLGGQRFVDIIDFLYCSDCAHAATGTKPCARMSYYAKGVTPPDDLLPNGKTHKGYGPP